MKRPAPFYPSDVMEQLRRMRDSDLPADRERAARMLSGASQLLALGHYEAALANHIAAGHPLPPGVLPLPDQHSAAS